MKQLALMSIKKTNEHGGSLARGRRKVRRPLASRRPIHLVLKARNSFVLLKNRKLVSALIEKMCRRFGIQLYQVAVHADHVHLTLQIAERSSYVKWIRAVTGALVLKCANLSWKLIPYTRIASWGRDFLNLKNYLTFNEREGDFIIEAHAMLMNFRRRHIEALEPKQESPIVTSTRILRSLTSRQFRCGFQRTSTGADCTRTRSGSCRS